MAQQLEDKDYIQLGKRFQTILDDNYAVLQPAWWQRIRLMIIHGFIGGIAGVLGATVGITILVFVLLQFRGIPVIGDFFRTVADAIKH